MIDPAKRTRNPAIINDVKFTLITSLSDESKEMKVREGYKMITLSASATRENLEG